MNNPSQPTPEKPAPAPLTNQQTYNIVSDLGAGVNLRLRDNIVQAIACFACLVLGAIIGALVTTDRIPGALVGAFIGLVVGLFGSGIGLMIYRAIRHAKGDHD